MRAVLVPFLAVVLGACGSPQLAESPPPPAPEEQEAAVAPPAPDAPSPPLATEASQAVATREPLALVFVHGWSNDARIWAEVAPLLADEARVLAVDLPGHGPSPAAADGDYSLDAMAQAVANAMDARGISRAILIGHGNGALVVRQFYRRWAERVAGLVIVDGSLSAFPGMNAYVEGVAGRLRGAEHDAQIEEIFDGLPLGGLSEFHREMLHAMLRDTPAAVQVASLRATLAPSVYAGDRIGAPVLLVMANAPFWGEEYRAYVKTLCPDLEAEWWSGVSHWIMLDRPREFADVLAAWAAQIAARD